MYSSGHYGTAMILYAPVVFVLMYLQLYPLAALASIIIVGGTRIPDWDLRIPVVQHRGITHTFLFVAFFGLLIGTALAGGVLYGYEKLPEPFLLFGSGEVTGVTVVIAALFGFACGALSIIAHLLADFITPMGLQPLHPFSDARYSAQIVKAKNPVANALLFTSGMIAVIVAAAAGIYLSGVLPGTEQAVFSLPF